MTCWQGVKLQRRMETAAYRAAGEATKAPAQRVGDFMASAGKFNRSQSEHRSRLEVEPTYARGVEWVDLNQVLPPFVARSLHAAIPLFNGRIRGFSDRMPCLRALKRAVRAPFASCATRQRARRCSRKRPIAAKIADESAGVAAASRTAEGRPSRAALPVRRGRGLCRRHYERRGRWPSRGGSDCRFVRIKKRNGRLAKAVRSLYAKSFASPARPGRGLSGARSATARDARYAPRWRCFHIEMKIVFEHRRPQRASQGGRGDGENALLFSGIVLGE